MTQRVTYEQPSSVSIRMKEKKKEGRTTNRIRHINHGRDVRRLTPKLLRPRLTQTLLWRDPLEQPRVHDRELTGEFEGFEVHQFELFEVSRDDGGREGAGSEVADRSGRGAL